MASPGLQPQAGPASQRPPMELGSGDRDCMGTRPGLVDFPFCQLGWGASLGFDWCWVGKHLENVSIGNFYSKVGRGSEPLRFGH